MPVAWITEMHPLPYVAICLQLGVSSPGVRERTKFGHEGGLAIGDHCAATAALCPSPAIKACMSTINMLSLNWGKTSKTAFLSVAPELDNSAVKKGNADVGKICKAELQ